MSMRVRTFRSAVAVVASSLGVQFLRIATVIVLARLLSPADFGIFGLAATLVGIASVTSGVGMGAALIAAKENTEKAAFHAFLINSSAGCLVVLIVLAIAPAYASFFGLEELAVVCRVMALMIVADTLIVVPTALLEKELLFGRIIVPTIVGPLTNMAVAVSMAFLGFGLWSLVIGAVAGSCASLAAVLVVCPTFGWLKPRRWDRSLGAFMGRFGVTSLGTHYVRYAYNNGDNLIVGKVLGATVLGFYKQAYTLANLPTESIATVVNRVLLPAYAKMRDDKQHLADAFLEGFRMVALVTVPFSMVVLSLAPDLVIILLGEKWRESIPILQVFAFLTLIRPLSATTSPLFLAMGLPSHNLRTAVLQGLAMALLIFAFLDFGAPGVALAVVAAFGVGFVHNLYLACWRTGVPLTPLSILWQLWPVVLAALAMVGVIVGLRQFLLGLTGGEPNLVYIALLVLVALASYTAVLLVLKRSLIAEILRLAAMATGLRREAPRRVPLAKAAGHG